ncbi:MAG TPA: GNAT family N-acetyltransferase, partial [Candidatus Acidoferrum sp.]|nr:GNAT family N-acetyltransferase [Candidatus Acidoferrum sp.]
YNLQNYDEEVEHLAAKCGLPSGRLYVIFVDGEPAGCGGLALLDGEHCELKSIFLRPEFRGQHISVAILDKLIEDAKEIGYRYIVLETMPFLNAALHLYKSKGFYETQRYYNSPMEHAIFLKYDL